MKILKRLKTISSFLALAVVVAVTLSAQSTVSAAERFPFVSGEVTTTSTTPIFNAFYNVPGIGDEAEFVEVRTSTGDPRHPAGGAGSTPYQKDLANAVCTNGAMFDIRSYIHNSASNLFNNNGTGTAIAHGTKIAMSAPINSTANSFTFSSTISANNAESISDDAVIDCGGDKRLKLELVANTVYSRRNLDSWISRSNSYVNGEMPIGSRVHDSGDMWACWDERVYVVYTVKVVEVPVQPVPAYTCDLLTLTLISDRKYRFDAKATAQNGAVVKSYRYDFNDGSTPRVNVNANTSDSTEYQYTKDGTFNPKVEVTFTVPKAEGGTEEKTVSGANCVKTVKIEPKVEMCPIPGKGHLPKNSPDCAEVKAVTTGAKLPKTGMGEGVAGLMAATTAAGTALHRKFTLRRNK